MKKTLALLATTTIVGISAPVFAADHSSAESKSNIKYKDNGGYEAESSIEETTAEGTEQSRESEKDVDVDAKGRVSTEVKTKHTSDPKGLGNEKKTITESQTEEKRNGGYKKTTDVKHKDAEGTDTSDSHTDEVSVDSEGNVEETVKSRHVVDPKGLGNKHVATSKTKTVNGILEEQKEDN